jgi:hypothetical protein
MALAIVCKIVVPAVAAGAVSAVAFHLFLDEWSWSGAACAALVIIDAIFIIAGVTSVVAGM